MWPSYDNEVIDAVSNVLKSGKINQWTGNEVKLFEKEFAEYIGTKHAIALSNGTVALELALIALDIGKDDEVIVTPRSFIASGMAIHTRNATPVFVDVDYSQNITLNTIRNGISSKTKAIICVHLAGLPCDMDPIVEYAKEHNIYVIEDCAQAHGASYKGRKVGSIGDIAAWSFCQDKIMSTGGEGGMITLNDTSLYKKAWSYKDHGKDYDIIFNTTHENKYKFKWVHSIPGTNWRMTEMQAAIGRILLKKLDDWIIVRRRNAKILTDKLSTFSFLRLSYPVNSDYYHAFYKYYVFFNNDKMDRDKIIEELNDLGIKCFSGSCSEIYLEKAFDNVPKRITNTSIAHELGDTSIMFMVHPTILEDEMTTIGNKLVDYFSDAQKSLL